MWMDSPLYVAMKYDRIGVGAAISRIPLTLHVFGVAKKFTGTSFISDANSCEVPQQYSHIRMLCKEYSCAPFYRTA